MFHCKLPLSSAFLVTLKQARMDSAYFDDVVYLQTTFRDDFLEYAYPQAFSIN